MIITAGRATLLVRAVDEMLDRHMTSCLRQMSGRR